MQRTNCNLELSLDFGSSSSSSNPKSSGEESLESSPALMHQHLPIFPEGRLSVFDVTDLKARAIIWCASRDIDESRSSPILSPSPSPQFQTCRSAGSSVKRSLQRFLQERKNRIRATSPYKHPPSLHLQNQC